MDNFQGIIFIQTRRYMTSFKFPLVYHSTIHNFDRLFLHYGEKEDYFILKDFVPKNPIVAPQEEVIPCESNICPLNSSFHRISFFFLKNVFPEGTQSQSAIPI